jgi:hypothetical protein
LLSFILSPNNQVPVFTNTADDAQAGQILEETKEAWLKVVGETLDFFLQIKEGKAYMA